MKLSSCDMDAVPLTPTVNCVTKLTTMVFMLDYNISHLFDAITQNDICQRNSSCCLSSSRSAVGEQPV
jgi:hypothetical protein